MDNGRTFLFHHQVWTYSLNIMLMLCLIGSTLLLLDKSNINTNQYPGSKEQYQTKQPFWKAILSFT